MTLLECIDIAERIFKPIEEMLPNGKVSIYQSISLDRLEIRIAFDRNNKLYYFQNSIDHRMFLDINEIQMFYKYALNSLENDIRPYLKAKEYKKDFKEMMK